MAVHDVHVKNGRSGALDLGDLLAQMRKIRRKDGWEDFNHCKAILAHRQKNQPVHTVNPSVNLMNNLAAAR
jgi:hypothetical protein